MPFTPAHAVVALPFARSRRWSAAAIAAGAVAPDLPLFLSGAEGYDVTHEPWAVPTLDVGLGLVLLVLWWGLVRPGLIAIAPAAIRSRVPATRSFPRLLLPVAVAAGALSHIGWDAFTHRHRLGEALIPALGEQVGPFAVTSWLQYASGAGGLAVLAVVATRRAARRAPDRTAGRSALGRASLPLAILAVLAPTGAALLAVATAAAGPQGPSLSGAAYTAATVLLTSAGVLVAAIGVLVRIRGRSRPLAETPGSP